MPFERIFLITIDCLRADHVGCIADSKLTPNIDSLAKNSIVFTKAFANGPSTNQSFPAILTSTYFLMHSRMQLLSYYTTIADVLRENGYKTAAFHSNPYLSKILGWSKGFDEFYDFMDSIKATTADFIRHKDSFLGGVFNLPSFIGRVAKRLGIKGFLKKIYHTFPRLSIPYLEGALLTTRAMNWIEQDHNNKFFLWLHYMDPHFPYIPPEPYLTEFASRKEAFLFNLSVDLETYPEERGKTIKNLYLGEIRYADACIGKLINFLKDKELLEDSLILLMADHGEAFMEHESYGHPDNILYNEVLHVPLIIYGLNISAKLEFPVQLLDVSPTITDFLGLKKAKSFLGESLLSQMERPNSSHPIFSESRKLNPFNLKYDPTKNVVSCIKYPHKIILNELSGTTKLYNIEKDFREKNDLSNGDTDMYKSLMASVKKHLSFISIKKKIQLKKMLSKV